MGKIGADMEERLADNGEKITGRRDKSSGLGDKLTGRKRLVGRQLR